MKKGPPKGKIPSVKRFLRKEQNGVITLSEKQQIVISAFRDGKSLRAISRETGIDRKTVTKYVRDYEEKRSQLLQEDKDIDIKELIDCIVEKPKYNSTNRTKRKLTDEIIDKIKYYLKENKKELEAKLNNKRKRLIFMKPLLQTAMILVILQFAIQLGN